jgi:phytoene dehydrogenase-like protein
MQTYQAIIVGGGHNGLVTAAYLARAGVRVLVLEARELVGGCAVTEEVWPGYRVSTASYLSSLMQDKVVRELNLERYGYRVDAKDPAFFSPFPDGRHLFMWQDRARTTAEIAKFSKHDAEAYPRYEAHLEKLAIVAESLLLTTPPEFPPRGVGDFIDYLKLLGRLRGLSRAETVGLVKVFTQSAADFLDDWFECEEIKVTLATDGVIGANGGPRSPGTAYILLHHCMGGVNGHRGLWGFVRGGMGAVSEAIAASARAHGAVIRTSAPVEKILTRQGRAAGVVLAGGEEILAPVIASNLDPKRTFLRLLEEGDLPAEFVAGIRRFRSEGTSLKINLALQGLPEFTAFPGAPGPQHKATMHLCPSIEYVERAWDDAKYGRPSRSPLIEMTIPTMYDATLAPPGRHIMGIFLQYAPYTLQGTDWDTEREPYTERVLDVIAEYCPNIRDIVVERQTLTPLDLERRFGLTGGNIFHGEMAVDQMFVLRPLAGFANYRTPLKGLYLCGSGAHPGGGVMGAPGHNAAREILRDR